MFKNHLEGRLYKRDFPRTVTRCCLTQQRLNQQRSNMLKQYSPPPHQVYTKLHKEKRTNLGIVSS